jgi:hypothetical protein
VCLLTLFTHTLYTRPLLLTHTLSPTLPLSHAHTLSHTLSPPLRPRRWRTRALRGPGTWSGEPSAAPTSTTGMSYVYVICIYVYMYMYIYICLSVLYVVCHLLQLLLQQVPYIPLYYCLYYCLIIPICFLFILISYSITVFYDYNIQHKPYNIHHTPHTTRQCAHQGHRRVRQHAHRHPLTPTPLQVRLVCVCVCMCVCVYVCVCVCVYVNMLTGIPSHLHPSR